MNIVFVCSLGIIKKEHGFYSDVASVRLRVLLPGKYLEDHGHKVNYLTISDHDDVSSFDYSNLNLDVAIISKTKNYSIPPLIRRMRASGIRIIADFCDDYTNHPAFGDKYAELVSSVIFNSDIVTATTDNLVNRIIQRSRKDVKSHVITDPVEGKKGTPQFSPDPNNIKLMWFGHPRNLPALEPLIIALSDTSKDKQIKLDIVTEISNPLIAFIENHNSRSTLKLKATNWCMENQQKSLSSCDAVVIPSKLDSFDNCKSPNRIVESIWAGRAVFAHTIPSYNAFSLSAFLGDNIPDLIACSLGKDSKVVVDRIVLGQDLVEQNHSLVSVGKKWESTISSEEK